MNLILKFGLLSQQTNQSCKWRKWWRTYCCSHEGCRSFEAREPLALTLPICANQLDKDIVEGGGQSHVSCEYSHVVPHHVHLVNKKIPRKGKMEQYSSSTFSIHPSTLPASSCTQNCGVHSLSANCELPFCPCLMAKETRSHALLQIQILGKCTVGIFPVDIQSPCQLCPCHKRALP